MNNVECICTGGTDVTTSMDFLPLDLDFALAEIDRPKLGKLQKREAWENARAAVLDDPNNLQLWNDLFKSLEEKWDKDIAEDQRKSVREAIVSCYDTLLARFPYLSEYWKMYLILQYKVSGVSASLQVLESARKKVPQSVSLWVDYLNARLATLSDMQETEDIRKKFEEAADIIGANFNSDAFWNLYIEFETKHSEPADKRLLNIYLRLISLPLYQYAQYYNQFLEIGKNYLVLDVITDKTVLSQYLEQFQKKKAEDLSTVEQHQIIDTYAYSVFLTTQKRVNEKWKYESLLTNQDFALSDPAITAQKSIWKTYLDYEIELLEKKENNTDLVVSVFERALVPNALDASMWLKYAEFTETYGDADTIYKRAILFVPLRESSVRQEYVNFLMRKDDFDAANEFLLDMLRKYSATLYAKDAYIHTVRQIVQLWQESVPRKTATSLEGLILGYFDRVDRYKKSTSSEMDETPEKYVLKPAYPTALSKSLNDDGICVVAVGYLQILEKSITGAENTKLKADITTKIRSFYNKYHKSTAFSRSVQFWRFFVEFEGTKHKNLVNLRSVMDHIRSATALPKKAVDSFIDMYYEITCANLRTAVSLGSLGQVNYVDILVNRDMEKSSDLKANKSARHRLAVNNFLIQEYGDQKNGFYSDAEKIDVLMNMRLRQLGHAGIFVDAVPEITNRLMRGRSISLLDSNLTVPPLPISRGVDRANMPVNYPDE